MSLWIWWRRMPPRGWKSSPGESDGGSVARLRRICECVRKPSIFQQLEEALGCKYRGPDPLTMDQARSLLAHLNWLDGRMPSEALKDYELEIDSDVLDRHIKRR